MYNVNLTNLEILLTQRPHGVTSNLQNCCIQINLFWKHLISVGEKPQRRQDIVDSALLETYMRFEYRSKQERGHTIKKKRMEKNNKYLKKCEDQGACFSPLPFESFGLAGREVFGSCEQLGEESI